MICVSGKNLMPRASLSKPDVNGVGPTFHPYSAAGFFARRGRSSNPPSNYSRNELEGRKPSTWSPSNLKSDNPR